MVGVGTSYGGSRSLEAQSIRPEFIRDLQQVLMMIRKTL